MPIRDKPLFKKKQQKTTLPSYFPGGWGSLKGLDTPEPLVSPALQRKDEEEYKCNPSGLLSLRHALGGAKLSSGNKLDQEGRRVSAVSL